MVCSSFHVKKIEDCGRRFRLSSGSLCSNVKALASRISGVRYDIAGSHTGCRNRSRHLVLALPIFNETDRRPEIELVPDLGFFNRGFRTEDFGQKISNGRIRTEDLEQRKKILISAVVKTSRSSRIFGVSGRNSCLVWRVQEIGKMASAGVVGASPKMPTKGFYQSFRESFSLLSVNSDNGVLRDQPVVKDIQEDKPRENPEGTPELSPKVKTKGDKPKNKSGKKKEIVSSSTVFPRLEVCIGKKCKARGSEALLEEFQTASEGKVEIAHTKCMHECKMGMNTRVTKDGTTFEFHHQVSSADISPMLCKHFDW